MSKTNTREKGGALDDRDLEARENPEVLDDNLEARGGLVHLERERTENRATSTTSVATTN